MFECVYSSLDLCRSSHLSVLSRHLSFSLICSPSPNSQSCRYIIRSPQLVVLFHSFQLFLFLAFDFLMVTCCIFFRLFFRFYVSWTFSFSFRYLTFFPLSVLSHSTPSPWIWLFLESSFFVVAQLAGSELRYSTLAPSYCFFWRWLFCFFFYLVPYGEFFFRLTFFSFCNLAGGLGWWFLLAPWVLILLSPFRLSFCIFQGSS